MLTSARLGALASAYAVFMLAGLTACQTSQRASSAQPEGTNDADFALAAPGGGEVDQANPSPAADDKAKPAAEAKEPVHGPEGSGEVFTLGPLSDPELQEAAYKILQDTVAAKKSLGEGAEETTELGDHSTFTYNIVKLLSGKDDISGEGGPADGMDVEVTGWYKRTVANRAEHQDPACTSFDALIAISKQGDAWHLTPGETPTFGREDSEDCF